MVDHIISVFPNAALSRFFILKIIMALTKTKKAEILKDLTAALPSASSIVFAHFKNLSVKDTSELRSKLREEGVEYRVVKKTLLKKAIGDKFSGEMPNLEGEIAVAWGTQDAIAPARGIHEFAKTHKDMISIVGGVFEGTFADMAKMQSVATIPSREVLYAQFAFLIRSPLQKFAIAISEISKSKE